MLERALYFSLWEEKMTRLSLEKIDLIYFWVSILHSMTHSSPIADRTVTITGSPLSYIPFSFVPRSFSGRRMSSFSSLGMKGLGGKERLTRGEDEGFRREGETY